MSKLKKIIQPQRAETDHPGPDVLASFLDGRLDGQERAEVTAHLGRCRDCYETVQQSLGLLEADRASVKKRLQGRGRQKMFAIAASIILCVMVGAGLWFKGGYQPGQQTYTASVEVDNALRNILLEDDSLTWSGEKAERFLELLEQRGVDLAGAETVLLADSYDPYQKKSLFGEREILVITVKDGVVHVEIRKEEEKTDE